MKNLFYLSFFIYFLMSDFAKAENIKSVVKIESPKKSKSTTKVKPVIDSIIKIKPEIRYDENLKYEQINKYVLPEDKKNGNKFDFGFDIDINQEERTIEYWKVDVKTNF